MNTELKLTPLSLDYLNQTRKWTYFLSIVGFVSCGLIALIGLFFGTFMSFMDEFSNDLNRRTSLPSGALFFITVIYLVLAFIIFLMYRYLYRFSVQLKAALNSNDVAVLEDSLKNLKSYWKFLGMFTLISLVIYAIGIIITLILAVVAGANAMT